VIYCLMRLRLPLFDLIKLRLKGTIRNMLLILSRVSNLIIGQEGEVLTCTFSTYFVSLDIPEWILLEQVDDCEKLSIF
jgi:hypothetical protein